jgi:5-formyltetrahydrofolate cyclo-ligase
MSLPQPTPDDPRIALKARLRAEALARRDAIAPEERARIAEEIATRPLPVTVSPALIISAYMPIRSELNPLPLLRRFGEAGARLALPAIAARGRPLSMRAWSIGEPLVRGQWGIREPAATAESVQPDVLLVPLAAFDPRGYRIGYGAGYYDLTLRTLRAAKQIVAIGLAFAVQEIPQVPDLPHDEPLDLVLTERAVIDCRAS